jgi:hypothetical protein
VAVLDGVARVVVSSKLWQKGKYDSVYDREVMKFMDSHHSMGRTVKELDLCEKEKKDQSMLERKTKGELLPSVLLTAFRFDRLRQHTQRFERRMEYQEMFVPIREEMLALSGSGKDVSIQGSLFPESFGGKNEFGKNRQKNRSKWRKRSLGSGGVQGFEWYLIGGVGRYKGRGGLLMSLDEEGAMGVEQMLAEDVVEEKRKIISEYVVMKMVAHIRWKRKELAKKMESLKPEEKPLFSENTFPSVTFDLYEDITILALVVYEHLRRLLICFCSREHIDQEIKGEAMKRRMEQVTGKVGGGMDKEGETIKTPTHNRLSEDEAMLDPKFGRTVYRKRFGC